MCDTCIMNCAIDTTKVQQDDGTKRGIEIVPEGCQPVSEDVCSSGYMAPAGNVSFPEDSLKQCCKCKDGEKCPLCEDPDACTEDEKDEFVTSENCFGAATGPSPGPSTSDDEEEEEDFTMYWVGAGALIALLFLIFIFVLLSR